MHSQDIALPLGPEFHVPAEYSRMGLDRVWQMSWPFHAKKKLSHLSLSATDTTWTVGTGPKISGPALALLLLLTGRRDAAPPNSTAPEPPRYAPEASSRPTRHPTRRND